MGLEHGLCITMKNHGFVLISCVHRVPIEIEMTK